MAAKNFTVFLCVFLLECFLTAKGQSLNNFGEPAFFRSSLEESEEVVESRRILGEKWFRQAVDHNNPDSGFWDQRYLVEEQFGIPSNNLAFLLLGGNQQIAKRSMSMHNAWIRYAYDFGAIAFHLEHRYYGESRPTSNLTTENLQYLSTAQALADAADFIKGMNRKYFTNQQATWVVFGGAYAGTLAAWLRLKYPRLVFAAVSSSAPVLAVPAYPEYFDLVARSLEYYGSDDCVRAIKVGFQDLHSLIDTTEGEETIKKEFKFCHESAQRNLTRQDKALFQSSLAHLFAFYYIEQYGAFSIKDMCNEMTNFHLGTPLQRIAAVSKYFAGDGCYDFDYEGRIGYLNNTSWNSLESRQWIYQQCTELGQFQTSPSSENVFGDGYRLDFFAQQCTDIFGPQFNQTTIEIGTDKTNENYGGFEIGLTDEANMIFVHNIIDPWWSLQVTDSSNIGAPVLVYGAAYRTADMFIYGVPPPDQHFVRYQILRFLGEWLSRS